MPYDYGHVNVARYEAVKQEILKLKQSNLTGEALVNRLNEIIRREGISDKPIALIPKDPNDPLAKDPKVASWNLGCGEHWVDNSKAEKVPAGAPVKNPSFNADGSLNVPKHNARLACCSAVLDVLKTKGITDLTLQEAPGNENDLFYQQNPTIKPNPATKSSTNRTAIVGGQDPTPAEAKLFDKVNELARRFGIRPKEFQIGVLDGNVVVNVHLDYKDAKDPNQMMAHHNRATFLTALQMIGVGIQGDTNMPSQSFAQALNNKGMHTFGIAGTQSVDVIIPAKSTAANHHHSPKPLEAKVETQQMPTPPKLSATANVAQVLGVKPAMNDTQSIQPTPHATYTSPTATTNTQTSVTSTKQEILGDQPVVNQSATELADEMKKSFKDFNLSFANADIIVRKGNQLSTFKIGFTDPDQAAAFKKHLEERGFGNVTYFPNSELHPMDKNGYVVEKGKGTYNDIVRFEASDQAMEYLSQMQVTNAEDLFNKLMEKQPTAKMLP